MTPDTILRWERAFDRVVTEDLSSRVLNLDEMAAATAGQLAAERQRANRVCDQIWETTWEQ